MTLAAIAVPPTPAPRTRSPQHVGRFERGPNMATSTTAETGLFWSFTQGAQVGALGTS